MEAICLTLDRTMLNHTGSQDQISEEKCKKKAEKWLSQVIAATNSWERKKERARKEECSPAGCRIPNVAGRMIFSVINAEDKRKKPMNGKTEEICQEWKHWQKWYGSSETQILKKRCSEYTEEPVQKDVHDLIKHDGVITKHRPGV